MNAFIVHAHPEPKSFCASMCTAAMDHLHALGYEVRLSDLYATNFNPVASAADFGQRRDDDHLVYALEQRHGHETGSLAPDIRTELGKLLWCDLLILNFPIFWFSTPAILKGWLDRVLISGVAYSGKRFYDRGGLAGKRVLISITIDGQAHLFEPDGIHGPLNEMLRHLLRGTLAYTGMTVLPPFVAWQVPRVSLETKQRILRDYHHHLATLKTMAPLDAPVLGDYDDRLIRLQPARGRAP